MDTPTTRGNTYKDVPDDDTLAPIQQTRCSRRSSEEESPMPCFDKVKTKSLATAPSQVNIYQYFQYE
jgi:hypothetical protein